MSVALNLAKYHLCLESLQPIQAQGSVTQVVGLVVESCGPACRLGAVCDIVTREGGRRLAAEAFPPAAEWSRGSRRQWCGSAAACSAA
jgi:flagellar biosynthesis/type III secretory pathway ATPase